MSLPRIQRMASEGHAPSSYLCIHKRLYANAVRPMSTAPSSKKGNKASATKAQPPRRAPRTSSNIKSTAPRANTNESSSVADAIRSAREHESALRAARLRRQGQREDREKERALKEEENKRYRKRYNTAARKWVSSIIALPILLVTSYYLFDRLALGNAPKPIPKAAREEVVSEEGS